MIIGITGYIGTGKTEIAEILVNKHGFIREFFGGIVREEAVARGLPMDRASLQKLGFELKEKYGQEEITRRIIKKLYLKNSVNYVVEGFRSAEDVKPFKKLPSFTLVKIETPFDMRCQRILSRGREGDPKVKEEFDIADKIDRGLIEEGYHQNSDECLKLADKVIVNNGSLEELHKKIETLLGELRGVKC